MISGDNLPTVYSSWALEGKELEGLRPFSVCRWRGKSSGGQQAVKT